MGAPRIERGTFRNQELQSTALPTELCPHIWLMSLELDPGLLPPIETQSLERKLLDGLCWKDMSCISPICYIVLLEYQADVVTQLKVQESSRLLFIYLVSKLDIRCIYSLVCKGIILFQAKPTCNCASMASAVMNIHFFYY